MHTLAATSSLFLVYRQRWVLLQAPGAGGTEPTRCDSLWYSCGGVWLFSPNAQLAFPLKYCGENTYIPTPREGRVRTPLTQATTRLGGQLLLSADDQNSVSSSTEIQID